MNSSWLEGPAPALLAAWPTLIPKVPWLPLGHPPTPVRRLERLSAAGGAEVWVKCDDVTSTEYGGNKVRKLELLLADAQARGARRLLAVGAMGSHHVLATAFFGRRLGFEIEGVLYPQPMTPHAQRNLELLHALCDTVTCVDRVGALPGVISSLGGVASGRTYVVPPGGSSPLGTVGYVSAGLELAAQIDAGLLPAPERIYVALGSGGTAAGLALGLALAGVRSLVVGVRVAPRAVANEPLCRLLIDRTRAMLRGWEGSIPEVVTARLTVEPGFLGGGYGVPSPQGEAAIEAAAQEGFTLESTYTGKAFAAMLHDLERRRGRGPLLFWNTVSSSLPALPAASER